MQLAKLYIFVIGIYTFVSTILSAVCVLGAVAVHILRHNMGHIEPAPKVRTCFALLTKTTCMPYYSQLLEMLQKKADKRKQLSCDSNTLVTPQNELEKGSNVPIGSHTSGTDKNKAVDQISQSEAVKNTRLDQIKHKKRMSNSKQNIREWEKEWEIYAIALDHLLFWILFLTNIVTAVTFLALLPQASQRKTT